MYPSAGILGDCVAGEKWLNPTGCGCKHTEILSGFTAFKYDL